MKFLFKYMSEPFDFSKSNAVTLVIENKKLFRHTILSVSECDCNEMFVFSENFKPLDFSKSVKYVDSVLTFEFSDRKMMTKVNSFFENLCNTKYFPQISEIKALCVSLCCELSKENDYDFQFCESIETMALVKLFSFALFYYLIDLHYSQTSNLKLGIKCTHYTVHGKSIRLFYNICIMIVNKIHTNHYQSQQVFRIQKLLSALSFQC